MKWLGAAALAVGLCGSLQAADPDSEVLERQLETAEGEERVRLLNELSAATRGNAPRESAEWAAEAEELAERIGDEPGRARSLNSLGVARYLLADYESALDCYGKSLALSEQLGASEAIADALNNIGVVHYIRGDQDRALEYYSRALEIRRESGDRAGMAMGYNNLGNVYYSAERYEESLRYLTESLAVYDEMGEEGIVVSLLNNIALVHHELERHDEALERLERAVEIAQRIDDQTALALTFNNLGGVADAQGRYADAMEHHNRSLDVRRQIGDRRGEADSLLSIGELYNNLGDYRRALAFLDRALEVASDIGVREIERDAYEELAKSHAGAGNFESAFGAHQSFKRVHDELLDDQADRRLSELEARHDMEAKDREIEILRGRQRLQRLVRNITAASAALLLLLIALLYNRFRLIRRANDALHLAQIEREKAARAELAHVARFSTLGEMAAALAHELNQPMTAILTNAETTRCLVSENRATPEVINDALADMVTGAGRAREIIRRLRDLIRRGEVSKERMAINDVLRHVEPFARVNARDMGVTLEMELGDDLPEIEGDPIQLQQVLLNLVHNGAEAMARNGAAGALGVTTSRGDLDHVVVAVRDAGPPVTDEVIDGMFEPFFTTKRDGLGMGLAICRTIIKAHGGEVWAERNPDHGLTVRFKLPRRGPRSGVV